MKRAALLVLALASTAHADEPRTCKPAGGVLLQYDQLVTKGALLATARTRLYKNGAYVTQTFDLKRTLATTTAGCVSEERLELFSQLVAAATWKTEPVVEPCVEKSPRFTELRVANKLVFVDRQCNPRHLDDDSQSALAEFLWIARVPTVDTVRRRSEFASHNLCRASPLGCDD